MVSITDTIEFSAPVHEVFELIVDSEKHSEFAKAKTSLSREIGGHCDWYGSMTGKILVFEPDKKLVHTWRGNDWPEDQYARVEMRFSERKNGTLVEFNIENIPGIEPYISIDWKRGWETAYWNPMKQWLANHMD